MSKSTAAKVPAKKTATTSTRAKALQPADARRLTKAEKEAREKRLAYNRAYAARKKAERDQAGKVAPTAPQAPTQAAAAPAATKLTKADMIGALRAQIVSEEAGASPNRNRIESLQIALQLAQLLAD